MYEKKRQADISTELDEYEPNDTVSKIIWDYFSNEPRFVTASWDGFVRIYEIVEKQRSGYAHLKNQYIVKRWECFLQNPITCCAINNSSIIVAGLSNGDIVAASPNNQQIILVGNHQAPLCEIFWIADMDVFISLGFDNKLKIWSFQTNSNNYLQKQYNLPQKTYTASFQFPFLLIGSSKSQGTILEVTRNTITNLNIPNKYDLFQMDSLSNFLCSKISAESKCAVLGCIDGRILTFQFEVVGNYGNNSIRVKGDPIKSRSQKKQMGKNQSQTALVNGVDILSIKGKPIYICCGSFNLQIYNIFKKAINATVKGLYESPITAVRLCPKNLYLVYAQGNDWLRGLDSLKDAKKPKLKAIRFKQSELQSFSY